MFMKSSESSKKRADPQVRPTKRSTPPNKFDGQFDDPHHIKACFKKGPGDFSPEPFYFLNE